MSNEQKKPVRRAKKARKAKKAVVLTQVSKEDFLCSAWGRAYAASKPHDVLCHINKKIVALSVVMALACAMFSQAEMPSSRHRWGYPPKPVAKIEFRQMPADTTRWQPTWKVQPLAVMLPKNVTCLSCKKQKPCITTKQ